MENIADKRSDAGPSQSTGEVLQKIKLIDKYPISFRFVIRQSILWFVLFAAVFGTYTWATSGEFPYIENQDLENQIEFKYAIWLWFLFGVFAFKFVYAFLFRMTFDCFVERAAVVISKGVIIKGKGTYPFSQITNTFIKRSFLDVLLGLATVSLASSFEPADAFAEIEGLASDDADKLHHELRSMLEAYQLRRQDLAG